MNHKKHKNQHGGNHNNVDVPIVHITDTVSDTVSVTVDDVTISETKKSKHEEDYPFFDCNSDLGA